MYYGNSRETFLSCVEDHGDSNYNKEEVGDTQFKSAFQRSSEGKNKSIDKQYGGVIGSFGRDAGLRYQSDSDSD